MRLVASPCYASACGGGWDADPRFLRCPVGNLRVTCYEDTGFRVKQGGWIQLLSTLEMTPDPSMVEAGTGVHSFGTITGPKVNEVVVTPASVVRPLD